MIDNYDFNRPFLRFQFESKLLLDRRENRGPIRIDPRLVIHSRFSAAFRLLSSEPFGCPVQFEIENSRDSRSIQHGATHYARQDFGKFR